MYVMFCFFVSGDEIAHGFGRNLQGGAGSDDEV